MSLEPSIKLFLPLDLWRVGSVGVWIGGPATGLWGERCECLGRACLALQLGPGGIGSAGVWTRVVPWPWWGGGVGFWLLGVGGMVSGLVGAPTGLWWGGVQMSGLGGVVWGVWPCGWAQGWRGQRNRNWVVIGVF